VTPDPPAPPPPEYAELAELAGSFIHEIKNRLSTLGLNLQLLAEDFQDPQSQKERRAFERVSRLQTECQRLVDVSNDFLRFARVKDLDLQPADLGEVIEELVDFFGPMARQNQIEIKSYLPADLPLLPLDREMFKQALLNLLLNAQQAMPEGGKLTIQAVVEAGERPEASATGGGTLCLMLIDTGKGMTPEVAAKVFRPFFSTKPGGTGLGLATTRRIIEAHGGRIELQSAAGRGTKVTIRLPISSQEKECPKHSPT
jgi:two-component system sensor histidine kinase HydH